MEKPMVKRRQDPTVEVDLAEENATKRPFQNVDRLGNFIDEV